jgi:hypothetical protein
LPDDDYALKRSLPGTSNKPKGKYHGNRPKKTLKVVCEFNPDHIIEKDIEIIPNTEETTTSTINVYCQFCNKFTNGEVHGELIPDDSLLRELGLNKRPEEE